MSYALTLGRPAAHLPTVSRARRDDVAMPAATPDATDTGSAAAVTGVTAVAPTRKRFRAVVCRTVTELTSVEFDADDNVNLNAMAEDIIGQLPADAAWTRDDSNSWSYIDRIEDLGPAGEAAPEAQLSDDMDEDDPLAPAEGDEEMKSRVTAEEVTLAVQDILAAAEQAQASAADTVEGADELIATLTALKTELETLQSESFTDDLPDEDAAASELLNNTLVTIGDMIAAAEESKATFEADGATEPPALV